MKQEFVRTYITAKLLVAKLGLQQTVSTIYEDDPENPASVEAAAACALENADITVPNPNEVTKVLNLAPEVSDDEDYENSEDNDIIFDAIIEKSENTETQAYAEEVVKDK